MYKFQDVVRILSLLQGLCSMRKINCFSVQRIQSKSKINLHFCALYLDHSMNLSAFRVVRRLTQVERGRHSVGAAPATVGSLSSCLNWISCLWSVPWPHDLIFSCLSGAASADTQRLGLRRRPSNPSPSSFSQELDFPRSLSLTASSVLPRKIKRTDTEYKSNSILKRLESGQKIMFVLWKFGQICVSVDVIGVTKRHATNLHQLLESLRMNVLCSSEDTSPCYSVLINSCMAYSTFCLQTCLCVSWINQRLTTP